MTAAAFQATFADWKLIKGRKVVQVVFEVPIELADHAYGVLGGMPNPASEVWCAVARLQTEGGEAPASNNVPADTRPRPSPPSDGAKRTFRELNPAQQAGILCNEEAFWLFLKERENLTIRSSEQCADAIRNFLNIKSRTEIAKDHRTRVLWNQYVTDYRAWMKEAEVIP
jgi:hypothetical protein